MKDRAGDSQRRHGAPSDCDPGHSFLCERRKKEDGVAGASDHRWV